MLELKVDGMTCGHCVRAVTDAVHSVAPQADVSIDLEHGLVQVADETGSLQTETMIRAIEEEGYKVH